MPQEQSVIFLMFYAENIVKLKLFKLYKWHNLLLTKIKNCRNCSKTSQKWPKRPLINNDKFYWIFIAGSVDRCYPVAKENYNRVQNCKNVLETHFLTSFLTHLLPSSPSPPPPPLAMLIIFTALHCATQNHNFQHWYGGRGRDQFTYSWETRENVHFPKIFAHDCRTDQSATTLVESRILRVNG